MGTLERFRDYFHAERWQLDYLFDLGFQAWLVHVGVVAATAVVLARVHPDADWPLLWGAAMAVLSLSLSLLARFYVRRTPADDAAVRRFGVVHTGLTFLVGIVWGLGAFGAATGSFENLLIYSLALGGTALGAVSSQHVLPRSCFVSLWTSVPLLAAAHLFHDPAYFGAVVMAMVLLYAAILSILSVRMLRFMRVNVTLTRSLDARLSELTRMAAELDQARAEAVEANLSRYAVPRPCEPRPAPADPRHRSLCRLPARSRSGPRGDRACRQRRWRGPFGQRSSGLVARHIASRCRRHRSPARARCA